MEHVGLLIEWNEEEGTFSGRDADHAYAVVAAASRAGLLGPDPMRSRAGLAAAFASLYALPPILDAERSAADRKADADAAALRAYFAKPAKPFRASPPQESQVTISREPRPHEENRSTSRTLGTIHRGNIYRGAGRNAEGKE
jgi:hypothetical protein